MRIKGIVLALILGYLGWASAFPRKDLKLAKPTRSRGSDDTGDSRLGIYDGTPTKITKHPYLATVLENGYLFCAGAILSDSWIITDPLCTTTFDKLELEVVVGSSDGVSGKTYQIKEMIEHPDYDEYSYSYNYALIKIKGTFKWGEKVANVTLPGAEPSVGTSFVVAGYGATMYLDLEASASNGQELLEGTMKWQSNATCESYYSSDGWDQSQACAYSKGKTTLCDGDYGDPFVKDGVLYGVAVGGASAYYCQSDAWPVVLANVYPVTGSRSTRGRPSPSPRGRLRTL